ncbi:MAG TPA: nuclear transport factor 2 family protein [Thermoanaerobaculia bacterium]
MRPALLFASVLLFAILSGAGLAQPSDPPQQSSSWSADEAQIRAAAKASAEAWNRGDLKGHLSIYVEDVTFMTSNGPRPGIAPLEESFSKKYFKDGRPKQTLSFEQIAVRPLGSDAALATGRFVLSGGGEPEQSGWFSLVWIRTPQGWKVVHDHSS